MIKEKRESGKDFWYSFDQYCETLTKSKKAEIADKLRHAKMHVNGLTDGWFEFKNGLDLIYKSDKAELTESELVDFEYLRKEIDKTLKNRL